METGKLLNWHLLPRGSREMPLQKIKKKREPNWKEWDRLAQKEGLRAPITAVNGDVYTGEWKDNLKHGQSNPLYSPSTVRRFLPRIQDTYRH